MGNEPQKKSNEENKPKQKPMETMKMATPEHENKASQTAQSINQSARQTGERAAEQTKRLGETAVEAGQEVTRVGADLLRQNAETLQEAMRLGLEMTTTVMGRSSDQFSRTFDLSGDEKATEHSARNAATTLQTTRAAAQAMSEMSREYSEFVRHQLENARNRMNQFWACRTPQEFAVLQSDFMRDSVQSAVECSRRMVDIMSAKVDDAAKHIRQNTQRPAA
ncbi:phasin family protein [Bradyrhizobium neotropicale]|uniref:phasin family protein n=1 Tax=Bradyrhizobium neotropicale TaxID=1497615 RepID=UPI001AD65ED8|nr:phasin family protein [Bradyrhizobium neotropicale]MBO4228522.1 phasin family protein [Bradyrhizobium neotropicale]